MLTNSSAILTHPLCTPNRRIKTTIATLYSSTFFYRAEENSRKDLFDAGKLQNAPSPKGRLPISAGHFTTLAKEPLPRDGPSQRHFYCGVNLHKDPFAARGELLQWLLCSRRGSRKGFVFAEEENSPSRGLPQLSKALENGRITRERCFRAR